MALSAWDKTRIYGTWYTHDGQRIPGTYTVTMPARVTIADGEAIVPAGVYATGELLAGTDVAPALDVYVPSNDDPDVTPHGWQIIIRVDLSPPGGAKVTETYVVDTPEGGEVNLRTVVLAQTIPARQTMLIRGVAGGVAPLDADGRVPAEHLPPGGGEGGEPLESYADQVAALPDYPNTFPPATHSHTTGDITGLTGALAGKVDDTDPRLSNARTPLAHDHAVNDVTGLQSALDGKQAAGNYAAASHSHGIAQVTGLQAALDGKQPAGAYAEANHDHDGEYRPASWTPTVADVPALPISKTTGLQSALDGKATTAQGAKADTAVQPGDLTALQPTILAAGATPPSDGIWLRRKA